MDRIIKVTSKGIKRVSPDTIEVSISVKAQDKSYDKMLKLSEKQLFIMQKVVEKSGLDKNQLRTQIYNIDTVYRDIKKNGVYESVFWGYECKQIFLLKFSMNIQILHSVLRNLDLCEVKPEFSIDFTLTNSLEVRDEALRIAATNARHEAELITEASGAHLGNLLKIEITNNGFSNRIIGFNLASTAPLTIGETGTMQPDNISVEVSAEFIWEIDSINC